MKKEKEINTYKKPNSFSRAFYRTSVLGQKLFCYSLYKITNEKDIKTTGAFVTFSVNEFSKALCIPASGKSYQNIKAAVKEIYEFNITVKDDDKDEQLDMFRVFQRASIDKNNILLQFSENATNILLKYQKKQFTLLALEQIGKLKSFYSIRYYEIALSWSGQKGKIKGHPNEWFFEFSFDEFKKMFKLDEMRTDNILSRAIKMPIDEINEVSNIKINYEIKREGKRLPTNIRFWCSFKDEEKENIPIDLFNFDKSQAEKRELDEDAKEYDRAMVIKQKYPKEWTEQEQESREKLDKLYGATTMQILVDIEVYKVLKEKLNL